MPLVSPLALLRRTRTHKRAIAKEVRAKGGTGGYAVLARGDVVSGELFMFEFGLELTLIVQQQCTQIAFISWLVDHIQNVVQRL